MGSGSYKNSRAAVMSGGLGGDERRSPREDSNSGIELRTFSDGAGDVDDGVYDERTNSSSPTSSLVEHYPPTKGRKGKGSDLLVDINGPVSSKPLTSKAASATTTPTPTIPESDLSWKTFTIAKWLSGFDPKPKLVGFPEKGGICWEIDGNKIRYQVRGREGGWDRVRLDWRCVAVEGWFQNYTETQVTMTVLKLCQPHLLRAMNTLELARLKAESKKVAVTK